MNTCFLRNEARLANKYLSNFPALTLLGARQVGKTTFAKSLGRDWKYFDLEKNADFEFISNNIDVFFEEFPDKVIIDESQEFPQLFKSMRGAIDKNRDQKGRFIVTGSSSPELFSHVSDSLAGRVGIINIGTLKANEFYGAPISNLYNAFNTRDKKDLLINPPQMTNKQMRHCWLYGGYPEPISQNNHDFFLEWMQNYYETYINRDIAKLFPRLNKIAYRRFLITLSSISGSIINKADLSRAIEVSESSIKEYLEIAEKTFIWRNIYYDASSNVKSIVKKTKGFIRDSGLLNFLQRNYNMDSLLLSANSGFSFEGFVTEELLKGIQASGIIGADYYYYRTAKGAEVDLIINCPAGNIPIEVKMATTVKKKQLSSLTKYINDNNSPFGILLNQSEHVFWVTDNIIQVPIGCL